MSRSESLVAPPLTNAWAITTERPPRAGRSARTRAMAAAQHARRGCARRRRAGRRRGGLEVGEGVDRDAVDQHGPADGRRWRTRMCRPGPLEQPGGEAEPDGRVVVAAGERRPAAPASMSRVTASESSATVSGAGSARS